MQELHSSACVFQCKTLKSILKIHYISVVHFVKQKYPGKLKLVGRHFEILLTERLRELYVNASMLCIT